ncbi:MAG: REP-associated tyrosine transposase [Betaproteobacteria bacterium]
MSGRPHRLPAFPYIGSQRYFLTFCACNRRTVFTTDVIVTTMLAQISQSSIRHAFAVLAYCFMPDHLHLLLAATSDSACLIPFAHDAKQRTGFRYRQMTGEALWQKGYYEHVVRDDEKTLTIARYIWANPVRAGIVREPREYAFAGSLVYGREEMEQAWASDELRL